MGLDGTLTGPVTSVSSQTQLASTPMAPVVACLPLPLLLRRRLHTTSFFSLPSPCLPLSARHASSHPHQTGAEHSTKPFP